MIEHYLQELTEGMTVGEAFNLGFIEFSKFAGDEEVIVPIHFEGYLSNVETGPNAYVAGVLSAIAFGVRFKGSQLSEGGSNGIAAMFVAWRRENV